MKNLSGYTQWNKVYKESFGGDTTELGLQDGMELAVADVTSPNTVLFRIKIKS